MSTSIQEQDLIQTIKDLQRRVNDLERNQRSIGIATVGGDTSVTIDGTTGTIRVKNGSLNTIVIGNL